MPLTRQSFHDENRHRNAPGGQNLNLQNTLGLRQDLTEDKGQKISLEVKSQQDYKYSP